MEIKKKIKNIGKIFIALKQESEGIIGQSVLIVDNGYSWLGYLNSAIEGIRNSFPKAEISLLTFPERKSNLQKDFPSLNYILPSRRLRPKACQIVLQMLKLRKKKFNFITLLSLDVIPLIVALVFLKGKVTLCNQWEQWWSIRIRKITELFKVTYTKKKTRFNLKNLLKRMGLLFILLQREDEQALKHSILVIDNGYASFAHLEYAIGRIKESLPQAKISVLALGQRKELKDNFSELEITSPGKCIIRKYHIARHMLRLRKNRYDYIILLSLDITPIIASMLFMQGRILLFNRWQQWWSLNLRSVGGYLTIIPQSIFNVLMFIYLLIDVFWIFLRRTLNIFRFSLTGRRT